jgi:hypothetical protein
MTLRRGFAVSAIFNPPKKMTAAMQAALLIIRKRNRLDTVVVNSVVASAYGTIFFPANPANNDTITINGEVLTFVAGTPSDAQVKIVTTADDDADNLAATLAAVVAYYGAHPSSAAYVSGGGSGLLIESVKPADTSITIAASAAIVSSANLVPQQVRMRANANSIPAES